MNLSMQFQQWLNCLTLAFHHLLKNFFPKSFPRTIRLNVRIAFQTATVKPRQQSNSADRTFSPQEFFQDTLTLFDTDEEVLAIAKDLDFKHELSYSYPYESPKLLDEIKVYEVLSLQQLYNELDQLEELHSTLNQERGSEEHCTRQHEERSIARPTNKDKAIQTKVSSRTSLLTQCFVFLGLVGFGFCIHFLVGQYYKANDDDRSILPLSEDKLNATHGTKTGEEIVLTRLEEDNRSIKDILTSSATKLLATSKNDMESVSYKVVKLTSDHKNQNSNDLQKLCLDGKSIVDEQDAAVEMLANHHEKKTEAEPEVANEEELQVVKEAAEKGMAIENSIRPERVYLKKTIQGRKIDESGRGEVIEKGKEPSMKRRQSVFYIRRGHIHNLLVNFCDFFRKIKTNIKKLLSKS